MSCKVCHRPTFACPFECSGNLVILAMNQRKKEKLEKEKKKKVENIVLSSYDKFKETIFYTQVIVPLKENVVREKKIENPRKHLDLLERRRRLDMLKKRVVAEKQVCYGEPLSACAVPIEVIAPGVVTDLLARLAEKISISFIAKERGKDKYSFPVIGEVKDNNEIFHSFKSELQKNVPAFGLLGGSRRYSEQNDLINLSRKQQIEERQKYSKEQQEQEDGRQISLQRRQTTQEDIQNRRRNFLNLKYQLRTGGKEGFIEFTEKGIPGLRRRMDFSKFKDQLEPGNIEVLDNNRFYNNPGKEVVSFGYEAGYTGVVLDGDAEYIYPPFDFMYDEYIVTDFSVDCLLVNLENFPLTLVTVPYTYYSILDFCGKNVANYDQVRSVMLRPNAKIYSLGSKNSGLDILKIQESYQISKILKSYQSNWDTLDYDFFSVPGENPLKQSGVFFGLYGNALQLPYLEKGVAVTSRVRVSVNFFGERI